jgi:PAS domain S-box-containing protein
VCVTDGNLNILSINKQFEILLGYAAHELKGKGLGVIAVDVSRSSCLFDAQQADPDKFTSRIVRFSARNGKVLQFSVGCVAVHNLAGQVESIILICQDVTESLRLSHDIVETQRELLYVMGDVVESRSQETGQHVKRVAVVARFLAIKAGLDADTADMIESAAPMHDIGKVGIRDQVLNKPGKLTPEEFEEMKHHARIGSDILGKVDRPLIKLAATIAREHHERWDGKGYPLGLAGEGISIAGRIVAIADVLDALFSTRTYKPAWTEQQVIAHFRTLSGLQFDPRLVDLLLAHWDTIRELHDGDAKYSLIT